MSSVANGNSTYLVPRIVSLTTSVRVLDETLIEIIIFESLTAVLVLKD